MTSQRSLRLPPAGRLLRAARSALREAVADLTVNKLRAVLGGASLFVGVAAVIGIVVVSAVSRDVLVSKEEQTDGRAPTMTTMLTPPELTTRWDTQLDAALTHRVVDQGGSYVTVVNTPAAATVSLPAGSPPAAVTRAATRSTDGAGVSLDLLGGNLRAVRAIPLLAGRGLATGPAVYPPQVVVNVPAAQQLGGVGTMLSLQVNPRDPPLAYRVVGVIADGQTNPVTYTSLTAALTYQPGLLSGNNSLAVLAHNAQLTSDQLGAQLSQAAADVRINPATLSIRRNDTVPQINADLRSTRNGFLAAAGLLLFATVLGLLNIGLASVRERARELTIRRALGATRTQIFLLVLTSSLAVGVVVGAIALAAGFAAVELLVPHLLGPRAGLTPPGFPLSGALIGVATGLGAALLGGTIPALLAARVDIGSALRD